MNYEIINAKAESALQKINDALDELEANRKEAVRVQGVIENTQKTLDDLDEQFCQKTRLTKIDAGFLFVAIGLQIARQYLLTQFPTRLDDQTAAQKTPFHIDEHSNRIHRYYNPSLEEIITNPVPFDANRGANHALIGGGKLGHRAMAIGHDPILGLIFGTANIATSTLTTAALSSYHISTKDKRDFFYKHARTDLVLSKTVDKLIHGGSNGKIIFGTSLLKELIHLSSDINTKNSLPLPFVSAIDPRTASALAAYGLDMSNVMAVGKQAGFAILINALIAMVHKEFDKSTDEEGAQLYKVRTRKILSYSNLVATSSNIAVVAITGDMKKLDLGGLCVTIYRLITDARFIRDVKESFIFGGYDRLIMGES